ncbi:MAG: hypothetical protein CBB72_002780 [Muricauda sp. TMED12]|jgi:hypothetical protein|nr:MAG: hypothetical protein CBB72_002780 [Muricauda sp. TMED12]|tara:strand:- start:189049 stop:190488 length:1440 start_codon:yes stop_codon:yes gene_type:complete
MLCFFCSILFFTSCSKDTDLFDEYVLQDPEKEPIENIDSDVTDGGNQEDGSQQNNGDGTNLLLNGTFKSANEWTLRNGSSAKEGILTVIANGSIGSTRDNWSAEYSNIAETSFYNTRRYRLTFDARQTVGSGNLVIGQRFTRFYDDPIAGTFTNYSIEFNGATFNGNASGNDLTFGGDTVGDTFEFQNMVLEDIGASTDPINTGQPAQVTFFTDFEASTYPYEQWGADGESPREINQWEVDHGDPRTTDHPDSPLKSGRNGGRAIWLGSYNNEPKRNEFGKDRALSFKEHWVGVSINVQNRLPGSRILLQNRLLANGSSNTVNAISIRQAEDANKLYFSLPIDVNSVDTLPTSGAGSNTESVSFDYTQGEWVDIVIHYVGAFGADYQGPDTSEMSRILGHEVRADGLIEIWVNGEKIVDHVGTTAYRYAKHGQEVTGIITPKIGAYWGGAFDPQGDIFYDNYKIWNGPGGSFEDLDPSK